MSGSGNGTLTDEISSSGKEPVARGESLVSKVLPMQICGPEFGPWNPPTRYRDPWGLLVSESRLLGVS